jgi:hypothetical protein
LRRDCIFEVTRLRPARDNVFLRCLLNLHALDRKRIDELVSPSSSTKSCSDRDDELQKYLATKEGTFANEATVRACNHDYAQTRRRELRCNRVILCLIFSYCFFSLFGHQCSRFRDLDPQGMYCIAPRPSSLLSRIQMKADALLRAPAEVRCALFAFHSSHLFIACGARGPGDTMPRQTYKALSCRWRCHSSGIVPPSRLQLFYYTHMRVRKYSSTLFYFLW